MLMGSVNENLCFFSIKKDLLNLYFKFCMQYYSEAISSTFPTKNPGEVKLIGVS